MADRSISSEARRDISAQCSVLDCFSANAVCKARYRAWGKLSPLNENHMRWAWFSLFGVMFADFYVWMVARGAIPNVRLI